MELLNEIAQWGFIFWIIYKQGNLGKLIATASDVVSDVTTTQGNPVEASNA